MSTYRYHDTCVQHLNLRQWKYRQLHLYNLHHRIFYTVHDMQHYIRNMRIHTFITDTIAMLALCATFYFLFAFAYTLTQ
jgi:hypothetical protein